MRKSADRQRSLRCARLLFAAAATLPALARASNTRNWIADNGNWSTPGNWNPTGVPAAGDTVDIVNNDATLRKITYDYSGAAVTLADIFISNSGGASDTLLLNSTNALTLTTSGVEDIGGFPSSGLSGAGIGALTLEDSNNNVRQLNLGYNLSDHGTYNLTGGGTLSVSGLNAVENVGLSGIGTFSQSNGENILSGVNTSLYVGANAGAAGTYSLSNDGILTIAGNNGNEYIGYSGTGTFTQSGGANNVSGTSSNLYLGYNTGAAGSYALSGTGTLTVPLAEYVGYNGSGSFNQSGGTNNVGASVGPGYLQVGGVAGTTATYSLSGTGILNAIGGVSIGGAGGSASFVQSGGTCSVTNPNSSIYVLSGGTYFLSGTGQISSATNEYVDGDSTALFNQTGGTNTTSSVLVLGDLSGDHGAYSLSGSGTLASAAEAIGGNGIGLFNQSSGTNSVTSTYLDLGYSQFTTGTYVLSGTGVLSVPGFEAIGYSGSGFFNQSGGSNTLLGTAAFSVGSLAGSNGAYALSGNGTLTANYTESIGDGGRGTFNQSGGANILLSTAVLEVGAAHGSVGTYYLGGTGTLSTSQGEYIGFGGTGTFNQSGGVNDLGGSSISLGYSHNANGTYLLSGGLLTNCDSIFVGLGDAVGVGTGLLTVSDSGQLTITGTLQVGGSSRANLDVSSTNVGNLVIFDGIVNLNGALTINYGSPGNDPVASIVAYLKNGYNGGAWTGGAGIISTSAQIQGGPALSVGYADGNTDSGTAAGPNQMVVKYTLAGDANLDGLVNFNDLVAVIQNFNKSGTDWAHGNFQYNAGTNFNDLVAVVQNFNKTLPPPGGSAVTLGGTTIPLDASPSIQSTDVDLPEPGALLIAPLAAASLALRKRRRR